MSDAAIPGEITALLDRWSAGDRAALADLAPVAYPDLRAIAAGFLRREGSGHTLQATALVNELYLRLAHQRSPHVESRAHFYSLAAMMMRRIVTDYARQNAAQKRPSAGQRVPLSPEIAWVDASGEDMLALDAALAELEADEARAVRAIELRYFLGCTSAEAAELLGVSTPTIERDVRFAIAWLYRRLAGTVAGKPGKQER